MLAAEPGPSGWRNADIAAIGRSDGGPAVLRDWMGTWTQAVPHQTAKLWTAARAVLRTPPCFVSDHAVPPAQDGIKILGTAVLPRLPRRR